MTEFFEKKKKRICFRKEDLEKRATHCGYGEWIGKPAGDGPPLSQRDGNPYVPVDEIVSWMDTIIRICEKTVCEGPVIFLVSVARGNV